MQSAANRIIAVTEQEWSMQQEQQWTYESAMEWIKGGFRWPGGRIKARAGYAPTDLDLSAVRYLVDEHGFEWRG